MKAYGGDFYRERDARTRHAAETILGLALDLLPPVRSAVDVGCGVGTWLSVLLERGVAEVRGVDGDWVDPSLLVIPRDRFVTADLRRALPELGRFDLAISLEVAEHLPPARAEGFVASLTRLSDAVLFSAAIPHQGGRDHVNERWQDEWARLFAVRGYAVLDLIRPRIWSDDRIAFWYRQNVLLYVEQERLPELRLPSGADRASPGAPLRIVHPEQYLRKIPEGAAAGWKMLRRGLRASIRRRLGLRVRR